HKKKPVPNQPFIPMVRAVLVDYTLSHSEAVSGKKEDDKQQNIELWHIYPFGFKRIYPADKRAGLKLIPVIEHQSNLFIGLDEVLPGKILSFLFQMEDNNFQELEDESNPVVWRYLHNNEWKNIEPTNILVDNTINFKGTGIIKLLMPEDMTKGNTLLSPDQYWLSVSCNEFNGSKIRGVFTQVATAVRADTASQEKMLILEPFLITEFAEKVPAVLTVQQPFPSYHASMAESRTQFYTWVSEHLRHKQRLITATDISQKILELFPQIHKVICFNSAAGRSVCHAGEDVQVVLLPTINNFDLADVMEPKVDIYTLYQVRKYLYENVSPFLKIIVRNPDYEKIKVVCHVSFKEIYKDRSANMMMQVLNRDIRKFISPWLYSADAEITMNNGIYPSEILNFIKELPYIKAVSGFNVIHFYNYYNPVTGKDEARLIDSLELHVKGDKNVFVRGKLGAGKMLIFKGSKPGAILISSENHLIEVQPSSQTGFGKEVDTAVKPPRTGIGRLAIGDELLVMQPYPYADYAGRQEENSSEDDNYDFVYNINA
ncbi:MAG TPA: hypothetical protein VKH37_00240, partial [Ferruginibacter sp.]|nr:hypothetical protein [Ferruginibacter sp.]